MRMKDYAFALIMCVLTLMTAFRYVAIRRFVDGSERYSFVIEADKQTVVEMKRKLEGVTFQSVIDEMLDEGVYKITVKCPPEKVTSVWVLLSNILERREKN